MTPLDSALAYAERGLPVFALNPRSKEPHPQLSPNGFKNATTDLEVIKGWWQQVPDANIGIAIPDHLMVIDVDPRNGGDVTWQQLSAGRSVETMTSVSGRGDGGFHLWLKRTDGAIKSKLGPGVDVKVGGKGYIVAPPSIHPDSGQAYTWQSEVVPTCPETWVAQLVTKPPTPKPAPSLATAGGSGTGRPGDDFTAATNWDDLLLADGWTPLSRVGDEYRWARPGKTSGVGATVNHLGTDRLKVFTSSVPGLDDEGTYDRFGYYAATRHGGDLAAAARDLAGQGYGSASQPIDLDWINEAGRKVDLTGPDDDDEDGSDEPDPHGWEVIDLDDVLGEGYIPPQPDVLFRNDGRALLYRGRINALIGESGSGKSWVSQAAIAQVIQMGQAAVVIDLEDHRGSYVARLRALGLSVEQIRSKLRYISPEQGLGAQAGAYLAQLIEDEQPGVVVIDSTGESMALQGIKPNDDDEVARWFRLLPRAIAGLGPAVLLLDHLPKASDAPQGFAIGSQRKRAAIDGAMYRVDVGVAPVKGKTGRLKLVCAKDRAGNWQHGSTVAEVTVVDQERLTNVTLGVPGDPNRPTVLMERVSDFLSKAGALTRTQIAQELKGKRDYLYKAIDVLIAEGYATEAVHQGRGGGRDVVLVKPFRDDSQVAWMANPANPAQPGPSPKDRVPDDPKHEPRQLRPPFIDMGAEGGVRGDRDGVAENESPPDDGAEFDDSEQDLVVDHEARRAKFIQELF